MICGNHITRTGLEPAKLSQCGLNASPYPIGHLVASLRGIEPLSLE